MKNLILTIYQISFKKDEVHCHSERSEESHKPLLPQNLRFFTSFRMTLGKYFLIFLLFCLLLSCDIDITKVVLPEEQIKDALLNTSSIPQNVFSLLEGNYTVEGAGNFFGSNAIIKCTRNYLSAFCSKNNSFCVFESGMNGNSMIFAGYWRFAQSDESGYIEMKIEDSITFSDLLNGIKPKSIVFNGNVYNANTDSNLPISFTFNYVGSLKQSDFLIIGHRGGGRNIDRYPASENSLAMLKYSERLGANAVEIDVKLTKDKVPVLFHDEYLSKRLIREEYFIGKVSDYSFELLRSFCSLKNGEKIPTLTEALDLVLNETDLKLVWLDIKATGLIELVAPILKEYNLKAKEIGRELEILIGIPDEDVFNEFISYKGFENIPSICELDESYVFRANSKVWAPRWSLGLLTDRVQAIQSQGKKVFIWTLDEPQFIKRFIGHKLYDAILTNYPTNVAYQHFSM